MTVREILWLSLCAVMLAYLVFYFIWISCTRRRQMRKIDTGFDFTSETTFRREPVPVSIERRRVDGSVSFTVGEMSAALAISIGGRSSQQDSVYLSPVQLENGSRLFAVLCDGMGGLSGGEKASACAVDTISRALSYPVAESQLSEVIFTALHDANEKVCGICDENGEPLNCGATALVVMVSETNVFWASAGDSRIYLFRGGKLRQLSTDQTYMLVLMEEVNSGSMTIQEAMSHPKRDALISYIGSGEHLAVDSGHSGGSLMQGDIMLLTSDGLYKTLSDAEIAAIISSADENIEKAATDLVETAIARGGARQDNTTVALIRQN